MIRLTVAANALICFCGGMLGGLVGVTISCALLDGGITHPQFWALVWATCAMVIFFLSLAAGAVIGRGQGAG